MAKWRRGAILVVMESSDRGPEFVDARIGGQTDATTAVLGRSQSVGALVGLGLVIGLVALFVVLSRAPNLEGDEESAPPPITEGVPPSSTARSGAVEQEERVSVEALPGRSRLDGPFALAAVASSANAEPVWIVGPDDGVRKRDDVPLWPGDWPYDILFAGDRLAFMNPPHALLLDAALDRDAEVLAPARYLVPGADHDSVWAIDAQIEKATEIALPAGEIRRQHDLDPAITWVSGAVADGFVVMADGDQRFWAADRGLEDFPVPVAGQSIFSQGQGTTAFVLSPGPMISAIDLVDGSRIDVTFDLGEAHVTEVCPSPGMQYMAIAGSMGRAIIVDLRQGATIHEFPVARGFDVIGWTSASELVYIGDNGDIVALEVPRVNDRTTVARVENTDPSQITLTGSAAFC